MSICKVIAIANQKDEVGKTTTLNLGVERAKQWKKCWQSNNGLPDIRWHDLRATYATILLKNNFNLKAVSKKLGHAKQIITADVYVDKKEIIADCIEELEPFIQDVLLKEVDVETRNYVKFQQT